MTRSNIVPDYVKYDFRERTKGIGFFTSKFTLSEISGSAGDQIAIVVHQSILTPYIYAASLVYDLSQLVANLNHILQRADYGLLGYSTNFKPLQSCYESITIWRNVNDIRSFFTGGLHFQIMERWKDYFKIGEHLLTSRFSITRDQIPKDYESSTSFWRKVKNLELKLYNA
eukprot:NODE_49_length_27162_cov_0.380039.p11 type:complete len:171 gc:universal NODE_49_length_27162_cov_0.380039:12577-13089(+)